LVQYLFICLTKCIKLELSRDKILFKVILMAQKINLLYDLCHTNINSTMPSSTKSTLWGLQLYIKSPSKFLGLYGWKEMFIHLLTTVIFQFLDLSRCFNISSIVFSLARLLKDTTKYRLILWGNSFMLLEKVKMRYLTQWNQVWWVRLSNLRAKKKFIKPLCTLIMLMDLVVNV
jgi:hypothetical protein